MPVSDLFRRLLQEDAASALDLVPGEEILYVTGRHWITLVVRLIVPLLGICVFGGLAFYRSIGGGFLVMETGEPVGFDLFNILLVMLELALLLLWVALWVRRSKDKSPRRALLAANVAVLALIYFRYSGGRIFYVDPGMFFGQAVDPLNLLLIGLATISAFSIFFVFYDWLNDELILTSRRVVYDNDQVFIPKLLEQRVQEQIYLEEIQDVFASTKTYPQHLLKYGTIEVKSARIGGRLVFASARDPKEMQRQIMGRVNALRRERTDVDFESMVEARVYNQRPPKAQRSLRIRQMDAAWMRWIFLANPEINDQNDSITWRPHWLFQLQGLLGPLGLLLGGWLVVILAARMAFLDPLWVGVVLGAILVTFLAWAAWEIEDYRNDLYILTPTNVIDIEKKPFGPEDRRQASLGSVTNVSFETTFVSNLLGYGNVLLETAGGGGKFTFARVPDPRDVVTVINDYYVAFKRHEKEKNLNDTLDLLRHYHLAQQRHNELKVEPEP